MDTLKARLQCSRRHGTNICTCFLLYPIVLLASFLTGASLALLSDISRSNETSEGVQNPVLRVGARFTSRKLLADTCSNRDISITQGRDSSSSGIPQFVVQIVNTCRASSCAPSDIHVFCGWFASAPLVNPKAFKRLAYNDCLVNDGNTLRPGEIIRFHYANSFMYPLMFKSAKFC
ncbi:hypothetical protein O6H91_05G007400 [Diphasiastrum complanatum]|uniref:Uncharacterized protein n=2 Tax=Diphasiastrum complanatum TaxID=34168 RepID=A0ACC2DL75_DIPCM|nr:hypothetical protein O6H91_05G007000 [Diphasiastrum complanatum]KAJ7554747.1 hypothetical protein O6H91_05G007400 [Diphasiastrum complanatum]